MALFVAPCQNHSGGEILEQRQEKPQKGVFSQIPNQMNQTEAEAGPKISDPAAFDAELTYQKVEDACRLLARGADFLATNPDLSCPTLFGFIPDCGSICQLLVNACGRRPVYIGKPDPTMIHLAWQQTGYGAAETLMVGDRLYTDIACGVNAGTDTALVLTGEATAADAAVSDTPPTLICRDMAELLERLKEAGK